MTKPKAKKSATKKTKGLASVAEHAPKAATPLNGDRPKGSRNTKEKPERIERRKFKQKLPCAINELVAIEKGDQLAKVCAQQADLAEEKRNALAGFRARKNHLEEMVAELVVAVNQHSETREVDCVEVLNTKAKTVETWRTDIDAMVTARPATGEDMQMQVFDKIDKASPKGDEPAKKEDSAMLGAVFHDEIAEVDAKNAEAGEAH